MTRRYCIGCVHFDMTPRDPGTMGSTWTGIYGNEEARAFCARQHWSLELDQEFTRDDFAESMEQAQECPDYEERPTP